MPRAVAETEDQAGGVPKEQRRGIAEKNPRNRHFYNAIWKCVLWRRNENNIKNKYEFIFYIHTKRLNISSAGKLSDHDSGTWGGVNTSGQAWDVWNKDTLFYLSSPEISVPQLYLFYHPAKSPLITTANTHHLLCLPPRWMLLNDETTYKGTFRTLHICRCIQWWHKGR